MGLSQLKSRSSWKDATRLYCTISRPVVVAYNDTDVVIHIYYYLHNAWAQSEPVDEEQDNKNENGGDNDSE
jgi:hypothetical protein